MPWLFVALPCFFFAIHCFPDFGERARGADRHGPTCVVSDVGDHRLQLVAADSEVACTSEVEVLFGFATGGNENGAGDQRAFLQLESRVLPDVAEQVGDGVAGEALWIAGVAGPPAKRRPASSRPAAMRGSGWSLLIMPPITSQVTM